MLLYKRSVFHFLKVFLKIFFSEFISICVLPKFRFGEVGYLIAELITLVYVFEKKVEFFVVTVSGGLMDRCSEAFEMVLALGIAPVILKHLSNIFTVKFVFTILWEHAGPVQKI